MPPFDLHDHQLHFIPARGRKLGSSFANIVNPYYCNLSPRGDGNPSWNNNSFCIYNCNLSPRGDGNNFIVWAMCPWLQVIAIYPREGTETLFPPAALAFHDIAIYPREGTETTLLYLLSFCRDCNLSPRGDGNKLDDATTLVATLQFIPARGRKPSISTITGLPPTIAIYPREGTETESCVHQCNPMPIAIYPREGTETKCIRRRRGPWGLQFIPARGRKHFVIDLERKQKYYRFIPVRGRKRHKELRERFELFS